MVWRWAAVEREWKPLCDVTDFTWTRSGSKRLTPSMKNGAKFGARCDHAFFEFAVGTF
jgi:hypothetical protein